LRVLAIAALALMLSLAACGGSGIKPLTAAQRQACAVHVYFDVSATRAQENAVGAALRRNPGVASVVFTLKAQALAKMKQKFPALFKNGVKLPPNPLPDSYIALPVELSDRPAIVASVKHAAGVERVMEAGSSLGLLSQCHS